ncbi:hypothetical protein DRW03_10800 [Corallococcus sp. H22C18031201]|uniref:hypothetical protein n=1 Tax=Citreicoccus inhibens TaxID=2849499 RepID=UPI000E74EBF7|nr:hypothetical protein [Citreicoccus inhibens]MBU8898712.1 hypothetical protein [Citreicoccus inhibens]RJS24086.1 hypothetical protein DRW03_10800 [Corallococcus sp. H22C18031201]
MRRFGSAVLAVSMLAGCGGPIAPESSTENTARQEAPLTSTDVDVAPECQGIIQFVNSASFQTLDVYLPSDVVNNLVARRTTAPFVTLAEVAAVRLVGPARLKQIEGGARTEHYITASCAGIVDELAVSADDAAAIVSLVNNISSTELHEVLPNAWNGAVNLLTQRPFTSVDAISNTTGIATVSMRGLRNAATLSKPFEDLAAAIEATPRGDFYGRVYRHFDWWGTLHHYGYRVSMQECFGIDAIDIPGYPNSLPPMRATLATAAEVNSVVANTVDYAHHMHPFPDALIAPGLNNLSAQTQGRTFKGCYFKYEEDPFSGHNMAFFVDTATGLGVMSEQYWSE